MRQTRVLPLTVGVLLASLLVGGGALVAAQDMASSPDFHGHPLVGTWLLDTDADDPENPTEVVIFTAAGGYISVDAEAFPSLGVWEATGEQSAVLTVSSGGVDDEGAFAGTFMIRATIEVDAAGDTFTAQYSGEFILPDGTSPGEFGPGTATATRLVAEPMGTPVGPFEALFAQFEGTPEATPQATPAS